MMDAVERAQRELDVSLAHVHSEPYNFALGAQQCDDLMQTDWSS